MAPSPPLVTAFWSDSNILIGGVIFHRMINSESELADLRNRLTATLLREEECLQFYPTSAAVVTFDQVSAFGGTPEIVCAIPIPAYTNTAIFAEQHFPSDPHD